MGWIPVARLGRVRGRRGELTAEIYSGKRSQFDAVALEIGGRRLETRVERLWFHDGTPVFQFAGIGSISEAEPWVGADVLVPPEEKLPLDDGEYAYADLAGCLVMDGDREVGRVAEVHEYGGPVTLAVTTPSGEVLIPFARDICTRIDIAAKTIHVSLPEGLLDL